MLNKRDSFVFYRSYAQSVEGLPDKDRLAVFDAIIKKSLDFEELELEGIQKNLFALIRPQIEANNKKYVNGCKGANYGGLGGAPVGNNNAKKQPQNNPKITPNENVNVNEECKCINEHVYIQEFPNWYSAYPNKKSMEKAKQAFIKIRSGGATLEELTNGLNSYIKHINQNNTQKQYIKHPATWLNQGCWKDEYEVKEEAAYNAFA